VRRLETENRHLKEGARALSAKYDGACREVQTLANRVKQWKYERDMAYSIRDDNAKVIDALRTELFELKAGIHEDIAKAQGVAMFYKAKLGKFLKAVEEAAKPYA
jgi:hypothetical protein